MYASTARQFADVNAFLTLAATRHKIPYEELREKPRVQEILNAAREGKVPAYLVSSESTVLGFLDAIMSHMHVSVFVAVHAQTSLKRTRSKSFRTTRQSSPSSPSSREGRTEVRFLRDRR